MSLDVYLKTREAIKKQASSGIFVRRNGRTAEITVDEWNSLYPDQEPIKFDSSEEETNTVFHSNITHNLNIMAENAGIYEHLWRPEELGITKAKELIEPLITGIKKLSKEPEYFQQFNPENGWGNYDNFIQFVTEYFVACVRYPDADIEVYR